MTAEPVQEVHVGRVGDAEFRAAVGRFATGVTVITAHHRGEDLGATVSAFSSVSNDPPTVLVCLNRTSETSAAVRASGRFAVNVMAKHQGDVAMHFARKAPDKFAELSVARSGRGLPLIEDSHMGMECEVIDAMEAGTHTIYIGRVTELSPHDGSEPLTYHSGAFGLFARPSEASVRGVGSASAQMAAYASWFGHHDMW